MFSRRNNRSNNDEFFVSALIGNVLIEEIGIWIGRTFLYPRYHGGVSFCLDHNNQMSTFGWLLMVQYFLNENLILVLHTFLFVLKCAFLFLLVSVFSAAFIHCSKMC